MSTRGDPSIHFRAPADEAALIKAAARRSGLQAGEWFRVVLLAAAGEKTLSEQLRRAAKAGQRP